MSALVFWSQLIEATKKIPDSFASFSIHFNGKNNVNGCVYWYSNYFKQQLAIGLVTSVGSNSLKNGVFDYYGVPAESLCAVQRAVT